MEYRYVDEDGKLLYVVARCSRKGEGCQAPFAQWYPDPSKRYGKSWGLPSGIRRVLYDLPKVLRAAADGRRIWLMEGEKDADRMALDFPDEVATTALSGAGKSKWRLEYTRFFAGASEVIIVADCDKAGLQYAEEVHNHVSKVVNRVRVVCTPLMEDGADFSDHRNYGYGLDEFEIVPFERATARPRMVIEVQEHHKEKPIPFKGFSQESLERSILGSMLRCGMAFGLCEVDVSSSPQLRIAVGAVSRMDARGGVVTPETVAAEIEAEGQGSYSQILAYLCEIERVAFDDTSKPVKAAHILRERSIRKGIALSCRTVEEAAQDERWPVGDVLAHMGRLAERHVDEYADLGREYSEPKSEVFTGDVAEEVVREEGMGANVRTLRPASTSGRQSVAQGG
ncbi:hypothetical protein [Streptomyces cucumeris]|uniref:hypothetical protein n=1 Tax=Streptomyces cucumeris TaxID=2962890 RepID=UPI0020C88744|nr:hypothetical protein [Streptomyces sp. NEAU-Y11]MCP9209641.1 hypothetical protein [Streptomyces sp. NEAU-Y11]